MISWAICVPHVKNANNTRVYLIHTCKCGNLLFICENSRTQIYSGHAHKGTMCLSLWLSCQAPASQLVPFENSLAHSLSLLLPILHLQQKPNTVSTAIILAALTLQICLWHRRIMAYRCWACEHCMEQRARVWRASCAEVERAELKQLIPLSQLAKQRKWASGCIKKRGEEEDIERERS